MVSSTTSASPPTRLWEPLIRARPAPPISLRVSSPGLRGAQGQCPVGLGACARNRDSKELTSPLLWSSRWMLARWRGRGGRRGSPSSSWEGSLQGAPHPRMDKLVITRSEPPSPIRLSRSQGRKVLWPMTPVGSRRVRHCGLCPDTLTDHPLDYRGLWGPTSWQATLADGCWGVSFALGNGVSPQSRSSAANLWLQHRATAIPATYHQRHHVGC